MDEIHNFETTTELAWDQQELQRLGHSLKLFKHNLTTEMENFITEAYEDTYGIDWDWRTDTDGCTCVDEAWWPENPMTKISYFPPCVAHDYGWARAMLIKDRRVRREIRKHTDRMFYECMLAYGMKKFNLPPFGFRNSAVGRFIGVKLGWLFWGRWKKPDGSDSA